MSDDDVLSSELARPLVRQEPDLHVTSQNGTWLHDVYLLDAKVSVVEMSDGSLLQRIAGTDLFVLSVPVAESRFPHLTLVETVEFDPATGAVAFLTSSGEKRVLASGHEG